MAEKLNRKHKVKRHKRGYMSHNNSETETIKNDREGMSLDFRMAVSAQDGGSPLVELGGREQRAAPRRMSTGVEMQAPSHYREHTSNACLLRKNSSISESISCLKAKEKEGSSQGRSLHEPF